MKRMLCVAATTAAIGLNVQYGRCDPPAEKQDSSAKEIAPSKDSPMQTMLLEGKAEDALDSDLAARFFDASTPAEKQFVRANLKEAIEVCRGELAVRKRWGEKAEENLIHSTGGKTDDEIQHAVFKISGDTASVQFQGETEPSSVFKFVHVDGVWKYALPADLKGQSDDDIKDIVAHVEKLAKKLAPFAEKVAKGEYKDPDSVTADVKRIMDADETSNP